jgi:hypothetical protein
MDKKRTMEKGKGEGLVVAQACSASRPSQQPASPANAQRKLAHELRRPNSQPARRTRPRASPPSLAAAATRAPHVSPPVHLLHATPPTAHADFLLRPSPDSTGRGGPRGHARGMALSPWHRAHATAPCRWMRSVHHPPPDHQPPWEPSSVAIKGGSPGLLGSFPSLPPPVATHHATPRAEKTDRKRESEQGGEGGGEEKEDAAGVKPRRRGFRSALLPEHHDPATALHRHPSFTKHRTVSLFG